MKKIMIGIFLFSIFFLSVSADLHPLPGNNLYGDIGGSNQFLSISTWGGILFLIFLGILLYRRKKISQKNLKNDK